MGKYHIGPELVLGGSNWMDYACVGTFSMLKACLSVWSPGREFPSLRRRYQSVAGTASKGAPV